MTHLGSQEVWHVSISDPIPKLYNQQPSLPNINITITAAVLMVDGTNQDSWMFYMLRLDKILIADVRELAVLMGKIVDAIRQDSVLP